MNVSSDKIEKLPDDLNDAVECYQPPFNPKLDAIMLDYVNKKYCPKMPAESIEFAVSIEKDSELMNKLKTRIMNKSSKYSDNHLDNDKSEEELKVNKMQGYLAEYALAYGSDEFDLGLRMVDEYQNVNQIDFVDAQGTTYDLKTTSSKDGSNLIWTKENYRNELEEEEKFREKIRNIVADKHIHSYFYDDDDKVFIGFEFQVDVNKVSEIADKFGCSKNDKNMFLQPYSGYSNGEDNQRQIYLLRSTVYDKGLDEDII